MGKKTDNLKSSLKMTNWEKNAQDISGFSAMPLVSLFVLAPLGAVVGTVIGGFVASSVVVGVLSGVVLGAVGGFASGVGIFSYGHARAKFAKKKYEARVIRINAKLQNPTMSWHQKITAAFNKAKNNDVPQKPSLKKTAQPKPPQNKK